MTTSAAVEAALGAQVDAIGFVFAESSRQLTPALASSLAAAARGRVKLTAVTRHPTQQSIEEILDVFRPDVLQTDVEDLHTLQLPQQLELLPVFRRWQGDDPELPGRLLFEGLASGSGMPCDWHGASQIARRSQLVLAGGLNASNVASAIAEVEPFGVDVSSGVEESPGIKSPAEIVRFVAAVRAVCCVGRSGIDVSERGPRNRVQCMPLHGRPVKGRPGST
jgi:phosphoribosylanthranilate isomerase